MGVKKKMKKIILMILVFASLFLMLCLYRMRFSYSNEQYFESFIITPLPDSVSKLEVEYTGGIDYTVKFYFEISSYDLENILVSKTYINLKQDSDQYKEFVNRVLPTIRFKKYPNPKQIVCCVYELHDRGEASFKYIACNDAKTKVFCYIQNY